MTNKKNNSKDGIELLFSFIGLIGFVVLAVGVLALITAYFVEEVEVERFFAIGLLAYMIAGAHPLMWCLVGGGMAAVGIFGLLAVE